MSSPLYEFAAAVMERRIRRGWSQEALAFGAGCSQPLISRLETGRRGEIGIATMRAIAEALGMRLVIRLEEPS